MKFNHIDIETKWQKYWSDNETFKTEVNPDKKTYFALDMFPFPSGTGLHVGHPKGYTATDILSRYKRMQGFNVLHPIGWDAFGLPAEQFALKEKKNPAVFTNQNIQTFKKQINALGFSYDWSREIATTDPEYYKWTQWIFKKLYENGLAEYKEMPVNFCPECATVLANEEVIDGKCERFGHQVEQRPMAQWVLKITKYADRLADDLDEVDWPHSVKEMQRNWIGKSVGANINFAVENSEEVITAFTTRPDTIFGVSYVVVAPENDLVEKITTTAQAAEVAAYVKATSLKSDRDRISDDKNKSGVFTGAHAINPLNGEKVQVWISDYVLNHYGTGCVMAVPAHDQRDYEFATKFNLPIKQVIEGDISESAILVDGKHINSDFIDGLNNDNAKAKVIEFLEANNCGESTTTFKLRDWLFSRQRYWGEPFPIVHMEDGSIKLLDDDELPVMLPELDHIEPSKTGESPLANALEWLEYTDPKTGMKGRRETNTMPQWAGSSWYYMRYIDPKNNEALGEEELLKQWLPVDIYIGGAEHAVLHLLYARFWHKFLYDLGIVPTKEPFQKLLNQGMILGENGEKMSKSKGNTVNPDDIVESHGADSLRLYEMFMGPLEASAAWSTDGLSGARRFLDRVYRIMDPELFEIVDECPELDKASNLVIKKVTENYDTFGFNTAISSMMEFINEVYKVKKISKTQLENFAKLLNPIAPHITEEMWNNLGNDNTITYAAWPQVDESKLVEDKVKIVFQVNGKLGEVVEMAAGSSKEDLEAAALANEKVIARIAAGNVVKVIVVPNKLVNVVVK